METRIISMTDRNNELIRKYFGEDCLLELQRQRGDADIIAVNVPDMRIAASSQPCKEGVQDDRDRDRDRDSARSIEIWEIGVEECDGSCIYWG